ncbi:S-adenosyl-L-methionine-dependent methyltransferase [Phanerochaete sordida]|uniref:S-adenosyl-L-methionine-dependent methyltransferase n=1 Tax=Phanerochaete sordida TaxID=48140 RepID=A0A9P3LF96_9APHY|nr:S-adenosyl-L-methionine-dependent methyltransferase [Phanerochaete sordida]
MTEITTEIDADLIGVRPLDESKLTLTEEERDFLHKAVTADDDELRQKITAIQKEAYAAYAYPCIYMFHFVRLFMRENPIYPAVVAAGQSKPTVFLDLGCCMGTDVRKLVADGYPAARVLGCDLRAEFPALGHKLFGDADSCGIHFFADDIFAVPDALPAHDAAGPLDVAAVTDLKQLYGHVDHFYAGALFHLFDEATQHALALRVARIVKHTPGTVVFGRHQGLEQAGYIEDGWSSRKRYGHSPASWPLLWKCVFAEVESPEFAETRVVVAAETRSASPTSVWLFWSVQII